MTQPVVRDDFSRGEAVAGLVWLSVGALVSLALEVVYLNWIWAVVALLFNAVLTKTARLWSQTGAPAPLGVGGGAFFISLAMLPPTGWSLVLFVAGIVGGVWPMVRRK